MLSKILRYHKAIVDDTTTNMADTVSITVTHHGKPHTFILPQQSTITELSIAVAETLYIPAANQKFMIPKQGLLKPPFSNPELPLSNLANTKITLLGSTTSEIHFIDSQATSAAKPRPVVRQTVKAYKTHDWKKEAEEAQYTFTTLRPLPYLPNSSKSLAFLQRLKDDAGIKAAMRKHKFTVPLLTEMNPIEHTQSNHEGTSRTLGLNRNRGEVIELRLRTDAYDGYRDYKTIKNTLCHELAHNVWGPHDRNFWDLCKQIEKEVAGADWKSGGRSVGEEEYYGSEEVDDHGGWTGGEFVLGASRKGGAESTGTGSASAGMSRREVLAKAAEERLKRLRDQGQGAGNGDGGSS